MSARRGVRQCEPQREEDYYRRMEKQGSRRWHSQNVDHPPQLFPTEMGEEAASTQENFSTILGTIIHKEAEYFYRISEKALIRVPPRTSLLL